MLLYVNVICKVQRVRQYWGVDFVVVKTKQKKVGGGGGGGEGEDHYELPSLGGK